jgi:ATP/ADP translocase
MVGMYPARDSFARLLPLDTTLLHIGSSAVAASSWIDLCHFRGGDSGDDDDDAVAASAFSIQPSGDTNDDAAPYYNHDDDAITNSTTTTIMSSLLLSGGGSSGDGGSMLTPQAQSVLCMSLAMAFHYLGYSLARSITVSLFTSDKTGFKNNHAAFPLAMTCISPVSLLLLLGYGAILDRYGAQWALMISTIACAVIIQGGAMLLFGGIRYHWQLFGRPVLPLVTLLLFIFRESYVQLLTSQYWSFLVSALSPDQSARWFGPIAGLTSLTSAVAGIIVTPIVQQLGLAGGLMGTSVALLLSLIAVSAAYGIAREHGFEPKQKKKKRRSGQGPGPSSQNGFLSFLQPKPVEVESSHGPFSMLGQANRLFQRVPVLSALFREILASQGLATILNVCFVSAIGTAIPNDQERAGYVGRYYSLINIITMALQFAVLPPLMTILEPRRLWQILPFLPLVITAYQVYQNTDQPSLYIVSASLLVMKVSEYSARRMLDEMIFVPLDFESRYLGKEVLGVFGYRLGKSPMSLAISAWGALDPSFGLRKQGILSNAVSILWLKTAWSLSTLVPTRAEAEKAHKRNK